MQRYFIYLAYDGANYHGWQIQPNGNSVQEELIKALSTFLRKEIDVVGAGRTDAGVHAALMIAHFDYEQKDELGREVILNPQTITDKLNRMLPQDISIFKVCRVKPDAHARFDATSRKYKYYITETKDPFKRDYFYKIHFPLDYAKMNKAAKVLFEYTDFTSFSKLHTDVKTNNCKISFAQWEQVDDHSWVFTIAADRFLRNMVRAIVGTLIEVGRGKISIDEFRTIIEQKDRCKAGTSVPGKALFLVDVTYPEAIFI